MGFKPQVRGSVPVSDRLSVAVGRSGSTGSQYDRAVPDRAQPDGTGGSVLPAGEKTGGVGRNRSQGSFPRRHEAGKPSGAVQFCESQRWCRQ